jgi:hypothetical protein
MYFFTFINESFSRNGFAFLLKKGILIILISKSQMHFSLFTKFNRTFGLFRTFMSRLQGQMGDKKVRDKWYARQPKDRKSSSQICLVISNGAIDKIITVDPRYSMSLWLLAVRLLCFLSRYSWFTALCNLWVKLYRKLSKKRWSPVQLNMFLTTSKYCSLLTCCYC